MTQPEQTPVEWVLRESVHWRAWAIALREAAERLDYVAFLMTNQALDQVKAGETPDYRKVVGEWEADVKTPLQAVHLASSKRTLADHLLRAVTYADARFQSGMAQLDQTEMRHHLYQIMHWLEPAVGLEKPEQWLINYARDLQTEAPLET